VVVDLSEQVIEERRHPSEALLRRQVDAFQRVMGELTELRPVLRREAKHIGDDPHRDVLRILAGGIHDVPALHGVDKGVAEFPGGRLLSTHRGFGKGREQ